MSLLPTQRGYWAWYLAKLDAVIRRKDTSSEPLDLVPINIAAMLCREKPAEVQPREVCESNEMTAYLGDIGE